MIHINIPNPPDTRIPINQDDWGDILTIGLHLKSRDSKSKNQWGVYMGLNKVGIKTSMGFNIVDTIEYNTSKKMHEEWILD